MQKPLTFLAPFVISLCLALPVAAQEETTIDTVVATVGGVEITVGHMIVVRASLPEQYQQLPGEVLFKGILDQLVQQTALAQSFEGKLPARAVLSLENERRSLTAGEMMESVMRDVVSPEEIQIAYDEQYSETNPDEEFNASHILVETKEEADTVKADLDGGADFAATAREKSTGPSGPSGGQLGWFSKGMMVPEFEQTVVEMEAGTVSEPVKTQFGWHVIMLNELRKKAAPEMNTVREELELQIRQTRVQAFIEARTAEAEVDRSGAEGVDISILSRTDLLE